MIQRGRQVVPLLVPLFIASLRRAENMALAMDARGYGSLPTRTSIVTLKYGGWDGLALGVSVLILIAAIFSPI